MKTLANISERMDSDEPDLAAGSAVPVRSLSKGESVALALKIAFTVACFWYLLQQIDVAELRRTLPDIDTRWSMLAVVLLIAEIPLVGLRWLQIAKVLTMRGSQLTFYWMTVAAAVAQFFGQILPVIAGDGVRVWFLGRFTNDWRDATISVMIDRCVGIGLLLAFTFAIVLLPSSVGPFQGDRDKVAITLAVMLAAAVACLALSAQFGPKLTSWRYGRWVDRFFSAGRAAVIGSRSAVILSSGCMIHALTIAAVWSLGRAQGLVLSPADAAVLFGVMVGVTLVPFTVGGWGLRELAMVSLFGNHGLTPERALVFSMYFGVASIAASLPGAVAWMVLLFSRAQRVRAIDPQV